MPCVQGDASLRKLAGDRVEFFGILNDYFGHGGLFNGGMINGDAALNGEKRAERD